MRNNWYMENYAGTIEGAKHTGEITSATNGGKIGGLPRADLAAGHAAVLTGEGHENTIYEFAADVPWTFDEFAAALTDVLGRPVAHRKVSVDEQTAILTAPACRPRRPDSSPASTRTSRTAALEVTPDLGRIIGRPTTPLRDALKPLV